MVRNRHGLPERGGDGRLRSLRLVRSEGAEGPSGRSDDVGAILRVAIASRDGKRLDAHFGAARRLLVFEVTRHDSHCVQIVGCSDDEADDEEDRIGPRVRALAGCHVLFALAIGPPAAVRVIRAGIHPITIDEPETIAAAITRARRLLDGEPPRWLQKALTAHDRKNPSSRRRQPAP